MRLHRRSPLVALALLLVLPLWSSSAPAPLPKRARLAPISLVAAYARIRIGMAEDELFALLAPFRRFRTRHHQWQQWTDGRMTIFVTIWPNEFPQGDGPFRVQDKSIHRNDQERSVPAN